MKESIQKQVKNRMVNEKFTTITGVIIFLLLILLFAKEIISVEIFVSTCMFPLGLLVSKDSWKHAC